jgi:hypothetical protein
MIGLTLIGHFSALPCSGHIIIIVIVGGGKVRVQRGEVNMNVGQLGRIRPRDQPFSWSHPCFAEFLHEGVQADPAQGGEATQPIES